MPKEYFSNYLEPSGHVFNCDPHLLRLIEEVKKYVCLYNINSLQYRDQNLKEECWNRISETLETRPSELKKEWKRLRDGYRQALIIRQASKNPLKRRLPLRPWKYEEKMSFLKPYMTPKSRRLDNPPGSENDEDEYHALVEGEEKEDVIDKIINNIKNEVLSDEEGLPQISVHASTCTSGENQPLNSDSKSKLIEKPKKETGKEAGSKKKSLKRKHMVSDNDSSSKQPCENIIVPAGRDKDGNLTISLANDKPKPKRLRYVTIASNLLGGPSANNINHKSANEKPKPKRLRYVTIASNLLGGPSANNINHQSISLNNPQSSNINNTTPVIIMNEKSIEKIISNFENSNISNIAISNVIGNCTNNVVSNTTTTSSGTSENQSAIASSGDKPSGTSDTAGTSVNNSSAQANVSSSFKNAGVQCEIRSIDKDREGTKKQSSINDLKNDAVAVFVHPEPNLPRSDDESEKDDLVSRKIRVRKYRIPEFRCQPNLANTLYSGNREQIYRAFRPSTSYNGNNGTRSIELFLASIYQTIKKLPWQGQNVIKIRSLEFLKVAEEEFEEVKVQWNKIEKIDLSKAQAENLDLELTSLNPYSNQENQDASSKENQEASNNNRDARNKNNHYISEINDQEANSKDNQAVSNHINQGTSSSLGQSYDSISSLHSVLSIFGDSDSRHIALRLFLASLYESMRDMPSFLLSYLNLMQLVVHVEEIYNNPEDFRNTAVNNKKSQ